MSGETYAFTTVVEVRSNSRYSGRIRWETETGIPSPSSRAATVS
jgi:hypothetical protein